VGIKELYIATSEYCIAKSYSARPGAGNVRWSTKFGQQPKETYLAIRFEVCKTSAQAKGFASNERWKVIENTEIEIDL